jgi:molybdopterin synthase sulfur carrier subunit
MIQIRYFASLREHLGTDAETYDPQGDVLRVADVAAALCRRGTPWAEAFGAQASVKAAVNQQMAGPETQVRDGDELAFFPPVTGG